MLNQIRKRGLLFTFAILFNRIVPEALFRCRYYTIFKMDVPSSKEFAPIDLELSCSSCSTPEEIESVQGLTGYHQSTENDTAWQAKVSNQLVAGFWSATNSFEERELGVRVQLEPNQAWLFSAFVAKPHRGARIFPNLLRFTINGLNDRNAPDQYAAVNPVNRSSMKVFSSQASSQVGSVLAIRLFAMVVCLSFGQVKRNRTITWNRNTAPIEIRL